MPTTASARVHQAPALHYGLVAALEAIAIAAIVVAAYFGAVGMGWFTVSGALGGLAWIALGLALGLGYVLYTLHMAMVRHATPERPYVLAGVLVLVGVAVVAVLGYLGVVGLGAFGVTSSVLGLAFVGFVLAVGLGYVLLTLRSFMAHPGEHKPHYMLAAGLAAAGLVVAVILAVSGYNGMGLFGQASAIFGLGATQFVILLGLLYVMFTLRSSIAELNYQAGAAAMPVGTPAGATAAAATARRPTAPSRPYGPSPALSALAPGQSMQTKAVRPATRPVTATTTARPTASQRWAALPPRKGDHAERTRHTPVEEIEGIGSVYGKRLRAMGINNTGQLKQADPSATAKKLGLHAREVRDWQAMADLMEVDGIGKQYSELLVRSGFGSVDELRRSTPAKVVNATAEAELRNERGTLRQARIQGNSVGEKAAQHWIEDAKRIA